nr:hypothetical protein [Olegusella massiliensis]
MAGVAPKTVKVDLYVLHTEGLEKLWQVRPAPLLSTACAKAEHLLSLQTPRATAAGLGVFGAALLLSAVLGISDAKQLRFGEYGKPYLVSGGPQFNLSDADNLVVLGVCEEELGVDVAPVMKNTSDRALFALGRALGIPHKKGDEPSAQLQELASDPIHFARQWARIEAVLKAQGTGFGVDSSIYLPWMNEWQLAYLNYATSVICVATAQCAQLCLHEFDADAWVASLKPSFEGCVYGRQ